MFRLITHLAAVILLAGVASVGLAEEVERPAWLSDEVVAAAMNIGLSEDQLVPFRASVREFLEGYRDEVQQLIRRGEMNLDQQIRRARNSLARQMDKQMAGVLSEEQMALYQDYRAELLKSVTPD